jgi:hypothetical protein
MIRDQKWLIRHQHYRPSISCKSLWNNPRQHRPATREKSNWNSSDFTVFNHGTLSTNPATGTKAANVFWMCKASSSAPGASTSQVNSITVYVVFFCISKIKRYKASIPILII